MARWTQEPKSPYELLQDYLAQKLGDLPFSCACDAGKILTDLDVPSMSDEELQALIAELKGKFRGAF